MREDDLGGHTSENEALGEAEEQEVVLPQDDCVRAGDPRPGTQGVDEHGGPVEEHGQQR